MDAAHPLLVQAGAPTRQVVSVFVQSLDAKLQSLAVLT